MRIDTFKYVIATILAGYTVYAYIVRLDKKNSVETCRYIIQTFLAVKRNILSSVL